MEKEFVTYKQAFALKELGFDEMCLGYYHTTLSSSDVDLIIGKTPNRFYHLIRMPEHFDTLAPLKQQVFRWFREKYSLLPNIWSGKINHIFYGYDILHIKKQKFVINNTDLGGGDCDYDTYEEAENACIDKLIELAKQQ